MVLLDKEKDSIVTWRSLPHKGQLALLFLSRFVDFLQTTSLQCFLSHQLRSFDPNLPDSTISTQAGLLLGSATAAQFVTALILAWIADAKWAGRKGVLLVGLVGTAVSCIGIAFSTSFEQAVRWRLLGGALNANGSVIAVMTAEVVKEHRFQSLAFALLPMSFNIAALLGPVIGGVTANAVSNYPHLFGRGSWIGGKYCLHWMMAFPFALPNLLNAALLLMVALCVLLWLRETLENHTQSFDVELCNIEGSASRWSRRAIDESLKPLDRTTRSCYFDHHCFHHNIFTSNLLYTLCALASFDFHTSAFNNLWPIFLSTPQFDATKTRKTDQKRTLPFIFTGGLGMPPSNVGFASSMLGGVGIILQIALYPRVHRRLGTLYCFQYFSLLFPIAYTLIPYISVLHSSIAVSSEACGPVVWFSIALILSLQVAGRTFALPAAVALLNDCAPYPSALSAVHGIGQVVYSASRTMGPVVSGHWNSFGLQNSMVGFAWWSISIAALLGWVASRQIRLRRES